MDPGRAATLLGLPFDSARPPLAEASWPQDCPPQEAPLVELPAALQEGQPVVAAVEFDSARPRPAQGQTVWKVAAVAALQAWVALVARLALLLLEVPRLVGQRP